MFIRRRGSNLSLERSVYDPRTKRRRTAYLGSLLADTAPSEVQANLRSAAAPDGSLWQLTADELQQLGRYLEANRDPWTCFKELPVFLSRVAAEFESQAAPLRARGISAMDDDVGLGTQRKAALAAWEAFECALKKSRVMRTRSGESHVTSEAGQPASTQAGDPS